MWSILRPLRTIISKAMAKLFSLTVAVFLAALMPWLRIWFSASFTSAGQRWRWGSEQRDVGAIVAATFLGPVFAVMISLWREARRDVRNRRLYVFRTLMATRRLAISNDHVNALNPSARDGGVPRTYQRRASPPRSARGCHPCFRNKMSLICPVRTPRLPGG